MQSLDNLTRHQTYDFSAFSPKEIKELTSALFAAALSPDLKKKLLNANMNFGGPLVAAAMRYWETQKNESRRGATSMFNGFWSGGVNVSVDETKNTLLVEGGKDSVPRQEVKIRPVTTLGSQRPGTSFIGNVITSWFYCDGKNVVRAINYVDWAKLYSNIPMHFDGLANWESVVREVMEGSMWSEVAQTEKNAISGARWVSYVTSKLQTCSMSDYLALHTSFILYVLSGLKQNAVTKKVEATKNFPVSMFTVVGESSMPEAERAAYRDVHEKLGMVALLTGPLPKVDSKHQAYTVKLVPTVSSGVIQAAQTFVRAKACLQKTLELTGGGKKGLNSLAANQGYTTFMAEDEIKIVRTMSMVFGAFSKQTSVVVIDSGISVSLWRTSFERFRHNHGDKAKIWKLQIVVSRDVIYSLADLDRPYALVEVPRDSFLVMFCKDFVEGAKPEEVLSKGSKWIEAVKNYSPKGFILRAPCFGSAFGSENCYFFTYGPPINFIGVCSSEKDPQMASVSPDGVTKFSSYTRSFKSADEWYSFIIQTCQWRLMIPLRPILCASEKCNLVCPDLKTQKVTMDDDGTYIFGTIAPKEEVDFAIGFGGKKTFRTNDDKVDVAYVEKASFSDDKEAWKKAHREKVQSSNSSNTSAEVLKAQTSEVPATAATTSQVTDVVPAHGQVVAEDEVVEEGTGLDWS